MSDHPAEADAKPRRRTGRAVAIVLTSGVVALAAAYGLAVWRVSGSEVAEGTTVAGVDIGGKTVDAAARTLEAALGEQADAAIQVTVGPTQTTVEPAAAGMTVDWDATAAQAARPVWDPRELWRRLTGDISVEPVRTVDQVALTNALQHLADTTASDPVEPTITLTDEATASLKPGSDGIALQVAPAATAVSAAFLANRTDPVQLPVVTVEPSVSATQAEDVYRTIAQPAVAKPVTLAIADEKVTVTPKDIAKTVRFSVQDGTLAPEVKAKKLRTLLDDQIEPLESSGRNARFVIEDGKPVIVKSKAGLGVADDDLGKAVLSAIPGTTAGDRTVTVELTKAQPSFTTADAKALHITEKLSSFRQWFPPAAYRWQNVGQAAAYINGTVLKPGDTFSMNDTIHERTTANGYTKGFIIQGGRFREELGGGVSIITTATWTAGFYAGLERVEQHPHGLYISRYKAGLEATVAWGLLDLRLRNDTGNGVLITATRYSNGVRIEMWGTKKFSQVTATFSNRYGFTGFSTIKDDSADCVASQGVGGFSISVTRRRYEGSKVVSKETFPTTYRPTPHVICTNPEATSA